MSKQSLHKSLNHATHIEDKMFVNTVNRRTRTIISRPLSIAPAADAELEILSETASSSSKSSFTTHSNDSAATLVNDVLVLQIAKESKDYEPSASTPLEYQHPLLRQQPLPPEDIHPLLRQSSAPKIRLIRTRDANRSSQYSQSSRNSRLSSKSSLHFRSTRRDDGRDRYSTMSLVLESYTE